MFCNKVILDSSAFDSLLLAALVFSTNRKIALRLLRA